MNYSIGQISEKTGLTTHAIRYYEKEGLLTNIKRNENGIRKFSDDDIIWISLISCLRETGMSIKDIKYMVDLSLKGKHTVAQRKSILENHKKKVQKQIDDLQNAVKKIDSKLAYYNSNNSKC
ncbi:MAG: MerR family transcriptional regulator [Anaeromicrobium sp.]|jgi:DNA-binding transcriptional MerR regulator|uniref:MerR family transcriptional regulator n=1 Tax=Anaeromicrobium sp. TaxID=1929132 RepID=UPI0025FB1DAF|nr:MerR family transcriptional regulator [Anaeromicrobium sp.]MCT4594014.1 MerR family transcriptional regulator [Anaeromicrobium sp.]